MGKREFESISLNHTKTRDYNFPDKQKITHDKHILFFGISYRLTVVLLPTEVPFHTD